MYKSTEAGEASNRLALGSFGVVTCYIVGMGSLCEMDDVQESLICIPKHTLDNRRIFSL